MKKLTFDSIKDYIYLPRLNEDEYKIRNTVRCILLNNKNEVGLLLIDRDDDFGKMKHFETPGGGVNEGESLIEALEREMSEEVGCKIKDIQYLCNISNEYNLLKRIDSATFFLAYADEFGETHFDDYEVDLIKGLIWIPLDNFEEYYDKYPPYKVSHIIYERDQKVLKLVRDLLKEKSL